MQSFTISLITINKFLFKDSVIHVGSHSPLTLSETEESSESSMSITSVSPEEYEDEDEDDLEWCEEDEDEDEEGADESTEDLGALGLVSFDLSTAEMVSNLFLK